MAENCLIKAAERNLPARFRPLFWSYRFGDLNVERDRKTIVVQVLNYGSLADWRWLVREYGVRDIEHVLESVPATEIKVRTRALASLLFPISSWNHAPRGAY